MIYFERIEGDYINGHSIPTFFAIFAPSFLGPRSFPFPPIAIFGMDNVTTLGKCVVCTSISHLFLVPLLERIVYPDLLLIWRHRVVLAFHPLTTPRWLFIVNR